VKNRGSKFIQFKNFLMYATFRNKLATLFFSKIFYYIFGYFKTFIGWETRHFNLNVLYKESDIILFSM